MRRQRCLVLTVAAGLSSTVVDPWRAGGDARGFVRFHSAVSTAHHYHAALIYCDFDGADLPEYPGDESGAAEFWYCAALVLP